MVDERIKKLAYGLVNYSVKLKENEKVLISLGGQDSLNLGREIIKEAYKPAKSSTFIEAYYKNKQGKKVYLPLSIVNVDMEE